MWLPRGDSLFSGIKSWNVQRILGLRSDVNQRNFPVEVSQKGNYLKPVKLKINQLIPGIHARKDNQVWWKSPLQWSPGKRIQMHESGKRTQSCNLLFCLSLLHNSKLFTANDVIVQCSFDAQKTIASSFETRSRVATTCTTCRLDGGTSAAHTYSRSTMRNWVSRRS